MKKHTSGSSHRENAQGFAALKKRVYDALNLDTAERG